MVGEQFQGQGYGKAALPELIEKIKPLPECREIFLSYAPENLAAERLYSSFGFERTGEMNDDGELVMRLDFNKSTDNRARTADN